MKKIIYTLFIIISIISCSSKEEKEDKVQKTKIRVGYLYEFAGASAVAVAKEKGFFEEENLDAELYEFFNGHAAILSMISKEIDFAYIGHAAHNLIIDGKAQILIPNGISKAEKIITAKSNNINTISDLKGKTVATHFGTSGEAMLLVALENAGLTTKDINLLNVNITNLENTLINKEADVISTWEPYTTHISGINYKMLADITNYSDKIILTSSFVSTLEYINNHRETVSKFSRAILKAMDYRKDHIDEAVEFVSKLNGNSIEAIKEEIDTGIWFSSSDISNACESGDILKWYETQQQIFLHSQIIDKDAAVTNYIQLKLLKSILNTL